MRIFVSGTGTGVGKTFVTQKLAKIFIARGLKVGIAKPIETGVETEAGAKMGAETGEKANKKAGAKNALTDAKKHQKTQNLQCKLSEICFYRFALPAAPFVADSRGEIEIETIKKKLEILESRCEILLIEGAGGLFVPIKKDYFMVDLIADLGGFCVLVSGANLGCINELLSARFALDSRQIPFLSVVNVFKSRDFNRVSRPFIELLEGNVILESSPKKRRESLNLIAQTLALKCQMPLKSTPSE